MRINEIEQGEYEKSDLQAYDEVREMERRQIQIIVFPKFSAQYMFPSEALRMDLYKFFSNSSRK